MSKTTIRDEDILYPERILSNLINDYISGKLDDNRVLYRCSVIEVDTIGGQLEDDPPNPKNSIKVRVISDAFDTVTNEEDLSVLYPLFPHDRMPIKPSEHVYAIFEDDLRTHGLWIARLPEPLANDAGLPVDSPNLVPGTKKYGATEKETQDLEKDPGVAPQPEEFTAEEVPRFTARVGDRVLEGSNNALIVIGRDRPSDVASGHKEGAGTIDLVAGRAAPEFTSEDVFQGGNDVDETDQGDKSRIYISMKTDVDKNNEIDVGDPKNEVAAILVKSDEIRILARKGMKIVVEGGDAHIEAKNIFLGKDAMESVVQGDAFNVIWQGVLRLLASHTHPAPVAVGPSPQLQSLILPANLQLEAAATGPVLSKTVKVKG